MVEKPSYEALEQRVRLLEELLAEQRRTDALLRENESSFSQLFKSAPIPMAYATEKDGYRGTTWNAAWYRMFGYPRELAEGRNGNDLGLWVDPVDRGCLIDRANRKNFVTDFETRLRCHDGSIRHCSLFGRFIERPGNRILMVIYLDITERKQAERKFHNLRNYLSNIIDSMPSVLVGVDAAGIVTQWNKTAERVTGVSASGAQGRRLPEVFPRLGPQMDLIAESIRAREVRQKLKVARITRHMTRYEDITIYPLTGNGVEGAVIRVDDVTEKVHMEEMMMQSEKMLSLGGLAAGMAHEINNPLAGIMQTAHLMANRLGALDIPANVRAAREAGLSLEAVKTYMESRRILPMLETIRKSGKRIADIVGNMLDFSRKGEAQASSHDPAELLEKALDWAATDYDLKRHYDFKSIDIVRVYEKPLPLIPCEGVKIQQVLLNVLRNGAQAMQEKRETLEGYQPRFFLRLIPEITQGMLRIEIEDTGPGMDEETCKRAFDPFFTTKPVGVGTGLGLFISYFIVTENHGGQMSVESHPGSGAKFVIRIPAIFFEPLDAE